MKSMDIKLEIEKFCLITKFFGLYTQYLLTNFIFLYFAEILQQDRLLQIY